MSQTLDYRRSEAVEVKQRSLAGALHSRERTYQAGAWFMLGFGIAATIAGPLLAAAIASRIETQLYPHALAVAGGVGLPFWAWLAIASAVLLPLLFWREIRAGPNAIEDETRRGVLQADSPQPSSREWWELRTTAASWAGLLELLLWGPRMVLGVRERFGATVGSATLADATSVLNYLRHFARGISIDELPVMRPAPALHYLVTRDWVGVSTSGDRVWLLSDARRALGLDAG